MGILSNIFSKIFPSSHPAAKQGGSAQAAPRPAPAPQAPQSSQSAQPQAQPQARPQQPPPAPPMAQVDVEEILNNMQRASGQQLNWRTSIVDLMKLLGLDSSLQARKELADELNYTGDKNDSATMNIWLHKQVMNKLAANGGKVPADLRD